MKFFVLDVDGVLTDGTYLYSKKEKFLKVFGPDDYDALKILSKLIKIIFVSADKRGFNISKKRIVDDMGFELFLIPSKKRIKWIDVKYGLNNTIYMGDGIFDYEIFKVVRYSIAPKNSFYKTLKKADFVTFHNGGNRAVAEACLHISKKFFGKNLLSL